MQLLIKKAKIVEPSSPFHGQTVDLLIENGTISQIKKGINKTGATVVEAEDLHLSGGWLDVGVQLGDPGLEHREDIYSVANAAAAGGYTGIITLPNTDPVIHSKSEVLYLKNHTRELPVDFYPMGAVSRDCNGKDITEMIDMSAAGAVAFGDGWKSIQDNGMMMRALQYVKTFKGLVVNHPHDKSVALDGQIHEGKTSTALGMKGIPALSEELMTIRDIRLLEYTQSKLHLSHISTHGTLKLIKEAKKRGLEISTSVDPYHLYYTDEALESFDTNLKVLPPLREKADKNALRKGIIDGTIDFISSNHIPWHEEAKKLEFPYAEFGTIGLETAFGLTNKILGDTLSIEAIIPLFGNRARSIFGIPQPKIEEGAAANLTLFQPNVVWTFEENNIHSKSKNTALIGEKLHGKVVGIFNNRQYKKVES